MSESPAAAVTYVGLPISSGGAHSLGRMPRRVAYHRTEAFIAERTALVGAIEYSFSVLDVPELTPVPRLKQEVKRRFGLNAPIAKQRVTEALDFLDDIHPQPTNQWGMAPIWFWMKAQIQILDPATGRPLPGQDPQRFGGVEYEWSVPLGTSRMRLILNTHAVLAVELCIPGADDDVLQRVVPWLQDRLPCKLSPKQWRAWTPTRSGSFKSRIIPAPGAPKV
jgi:hypothetical protein